MEPVTERSTGFVDLCVICKQGITRGALIFVNAKSYHYTCYAAFGQKSGSVKPS